MSEHVAQAVAEYRAAHPEASDLPDEALAKLSIVQRRVVGLAMVDFGNSLAQSWGEAMRGLLRQKS